jgi:hypothetical protein
MVLNRSSEEGSDVVPVILDDELSLLEVVLPVHFQLIYEESELLIVSILLNSACPLEAVHDQSKAYLCVSHAHAYVCLEKL